MLLLSLASALALTASEAETVAGLIERLEPQAGGFAYDEEEADRLYDEDEAADGLIAAAGFDRDAWRAALDATFRGFLAALPEEEFTATVSTLRARLDASRSITEEQRAALLEMVVENVGRLETMREEGARDAAAVRPLVPRIRRLSGGD